MKWDLRLIEPVIVVLFCLTSVLLYILCIDDIKYDDPYYALIRFICIGWIIVVMSGLEYINILEETVRPNIAKIIFRSILLTFDLVYIIIVHIVLIKNIIQYQNIWMNTIAVCIFSDLVGLKIVFNRLDLLWD